MHNVPLAALGLLYGMRDNMKEVHIVLVHGTFARRAAWMRNGSTLRHFLQHNAPAHITFHPFAWSGLNSYFARIAASKKLSTFVERLADTYGNAPIFIIAHSHGGNIALYAMRNPATANRVAGLITLSTPFLVVRRRLLNAVGAAGLLCALVVLVSAGQGLFPAACYALVQRFFDSSEFCSGHSILVFFLIMAYMFAIATVPYTFAKWLSWLEYNLSLPHIDTTSLLVVRGPRDEASGFLGTLHFLETLVAFLSERQGVVDNFIRRSAKFIRQKNTSIYPFIVRLLRIWIITGLSLLILFFILSHYMATAAPSFYDTISSSLAQHEHARRVLIAISIIPGLLVPIYFGIIVIAVVGIAVTVGTVCLVSLTAISVLFRPELGPFSGALVVSVEPCPPGLWQVLQIDGAGTRTFLWHSATYTHPAALNEGD